MMDSFQAWDWDRADVPGTHLLAVLISFFPIGKAH